MDEHLQHLEIVLEVLREHKLYANKKKCSFAYQRVEYLGHIVSRKGVEVDPKKIRSIKQCPVPTNVREVRGFLGLTGYYRRFIQHYGSIAAPLTQLLKLGAFKWNDKAQLAFTRLQEAMMTFPMLALPDFSVPFEVEKDASGYGAGAILMQNNRPIAFLNHTLTLRNLAKPVYERELMVVVSAVQRLRPYLLGRKFLVKTDQRSLKFLLKQRLGLENEAAEALSRIPPTVHLNQLTAPALIDLKIIKEEVEKDEHLKEILVKLRNVRYVPKQQDNVRYSSWVVETIGIPNRVWDDISMDFIEGLPKAAGFKVILMVVDRFSKYAHFLTLKHPFDATVVAELFVKEVLAGTKLNRSTAYHPQMDGQTELKRTFRECQNPQELAPYMIENQEWLVVPDKVYGYQKNDQGFWEVLMRWKGLPRHENSYKYTLNADYPGDPP
ncbi:Transposon Tf2-6 polyprotein [Cucumis melo var. makuwa]|uniref:Transposon Tf2-6 polyprotein n=1 Tax=Cucumis melo var. makuwa TaxID=1194695 RepID=A0A5D3DDL8_CUCMM|nr:Transposon Tf2-6 polyprotein [Cucumis melo var. makuwa]